MAALKSFAASLLIVLLLETAVQAVSPKQGAVKLEEGLFLGFLWPLRGQTSSSYGKRIDPISTDILKHHAGLDIAASEGMWVTASRAGRVIFAGTSGGYGKLVALSHPNETETRYGHLSSIKVKKDTFVRPGQVLGTVGNSGRSTGYHLHFEVRVKGLPVDPTKWLVPYGFMMPLRESPATRLEQRNVRAWPKN